MYIYIHVYIYEYIYVQKMGLLLQATRIKYVCLIYLHLFLCAYKNVYVH